MSAEAVPQPEPNQLQPELTLVPGLRPEDATEAVAAYVRAVDREVIPASVDEADEAARMIRTYNERVQKAISEGKSHVDEEVAESLHETAESGVNMWRLSDTEVEDYTNIARAKAPTSLSLTAKTYLEDGKSFAALKREANARLKLDRELHDRELGAQTDKLAASMKAAGFEIDEEVAKERKTPTQKREEASKPTSEAVDLTDTGIIVDANGRGHRDHGKFISKKQLVQIEANADLIRSDQQGSREEYEAREAKRRAEVDKDIAAKARKIAFKSGFGTRALERTEGLKTMIDKEATKQAASEGQDVAYRDEIQMPEGFKAEAWDIMDEDMRRTAVEEWSKMSEDEKSEAFAGEFDFSKPLAEMDTHTREAYFANAKEAVELLKEEPVTAITPDSLVARSKRIFAKAGKRLAQVYTTVGNKIINPLDQELTETQKKRRGAVIAVGVGALAVAKLYTTLHGMEHGASASAAPQPVVPAETLQPKFDNVTLHNGDSIWKLEEARHPRMSEAHIQQLVERDLKANHLTWEDARHLTPGQHIKISHK